MLCSTANIYGLDIIASKGTNKVRGDAQSMPFKEASFDSIVAGELIEHLDRPWDFLEEAYRVLRPGGHLLITTPNKEAWLNKLTGFLEPDKDRVRNPLGKVTMSSSFKRLVGYSISPPKEYKAEYRHKMLFDENALINMCGRSGFHVEQVTYYPYGGWDSWIGRMIDVLRRIIHRIIPRTLRECIIVVCAKTVEH